MKRERATAPALLALMLLAGSLIGAADHSVRQWGTWNGLPSNNIQAVLRSSDGYLWVGAPAGLFRFNGVMFELILDMPVYSLAETHDGGLWCGGEAELILRSPAGLSRYPCAAQEPGSIRQVLLLRDGSVLALTHHALFRLRNGTMEPVDAGPDARGFYRMLEGPDGTLYVACSTGLFALRPGQPAQPASDRFPREQHVVDLAFDASGVLWLGTDSGPLRADAAPERVPFLPVKVRVLLPAEGGLLVGTHGNGLLLLDGERVEAYPSRDTFRGEVITCLHRDAEGLIWVGTAGSGLFQIRRNRFAARTMQDGLPGDVLSCLHQDPDGTLWVGMVNGLFRCPKGDLGRSTAVDALSGRYVTAVCRDAEGALWVGTAGEGLYRLEGDRPVPVCHGATGLPLPRSPVTALMPRPGGGVWVATDEGIYLANEAPGFLRPVGPFGGEVLAIAPGAGAQLWVATPQGLHRWRESGPPERPSWTPVTSATQGGIRVKVLCLAAGPGGEMWGGLQEGGLLLVREERVLRVPLAGEAPGPLVHALALDGEGAMWMMTPKGILRTSLEALRARASGGSSSLQIETFGLADGLLSLERVIPGSPPLLSLQDGRMAVASYKGLAVADPGEMRRPTPPVPVVVEGFLVDGLPRPAGDRLPPGPRKVEFRYAGLSFAAPEALRYRYRLRGVEEGWEEARGERSVVYSNLGPGEYRFEVEAFPAADERARGRASLDFTVRPRLRDRPLVYLLAALLLLWAGAGFQQVRIRRQRRRAAELEALVAARTRDLASRTEELGLANRLLGEEKGRSEDLLLNILPASIAARLKDGEGTIADQFDEVAILFCDVVDFSSLSARLPASELVDLLNELFSAFDAIAARFGLEKIKTIGDAYMVVGGAPVPTPDAPVRTAAMALEMLREAAEISSRRGTTLAVRMGFHVGPAVAGVIGTRKFTYDLWGEAVNLASRLQTASHPGRVLVSAAVRERLDQWFEFEARGRVELKGFGLQPAWYLLGPRRSDRPAGGPPPAGR